MYPLIYRLHAKFNLSGMQREGRQLKRAMIADAKSGSQDILFRCRNKGKSEGNIKSVFIKDTTFKLLNNHIELDLILSQTRPPTQ